METHRKTCLILLGALQVAAAMGGCLGEGASPPSPNSEPPYGLPSGPTSFISLNLATLGLSNEFLEVEVEVLEATAITLNLLRDEAAENNDLYQSCGRTGYSVSGASIGLVEHEAAWSEAGGAAALVAYGGRAEAIPLRGAIQQRTGGGEDSHSYRVLPHDRIRLWIAVNEPGHTEFSSRAEAIVAASVTNALRVVSATSEPFRCGAHLGDFSGTFEYARTVGPSITRIERASVEVVTHNGTDAGMTMVVRSDYHVPTRCDLRIFLDGEEVARSGDDAFVCTVSYRGPPGTLRFLIEDSYGPEATIAYTLHDRSQE